MHLSDFFCARPKNSGSRARLDSLISILFPWQRSFKILKCLGKPVTNSCRTQKKTERVSWGDNAIVALASFLLTVEIICAAWLVEGEKVVEEYVEEVKDKWSSSE